MSYLSNWTGQDIRIPQNEFLDAKDLSELNRPGVTIQSVQMTTLKKKVVNHCFFLYLIM